MGRKARERATALALRRRLAAEGVVVRAARPGEGATVRQLVLPVDPEHPEMFDSLASMIDSGIGVTAAKGKAVHLVAENGRGELVAALSAISPFDWLQGTSEIKQPIKDALARSVVTVEALAVAPAARGMQLGQQLLKRAEELLRAEGCRLLIADFEPSRPHLARYYTRAGFSLLPEGQAMHVGLPGGVILPRESHTDCRTSWKALDAGITVEPGLMVQEHSQTPEPVPGGVLVGVLPSNWATAGLAP
ncbi:GNAT family N-acetyltransferase [Streptomyces virginiae]|uniref:GNAT family N-acetyltransferase n=1 Tax=Streptomyces virginiae TaxID=1961 RepID=UPI00324ED609